MTAPPSLRATRPLPASNWSSAWRVVNRPDGQGRLARHQLWRKQQLQAGLAGQLVERRAQSLGSDRDLMDLSLCRLSDRRPAQARGESSSKRHGHQRWIGFSHERNLQGSVRNINHYLWSRMACTNPHIEGAVFFWRAGGQRCATSRPR